MRERKGERQADREKKRDMERALGVAREFKAKVPSSRFLDGLVNR